jgi:ADP-ribose pyrophosphatase
MPLKSWKKVRQVLEVKNPWWSYRKDEVILPSGKTGEYHLAHTNGSSMVVPLLDDGRIILVNQYRYTGNRESLEFPCGSVKDGSTYDETAWHELSEETGFTANELAFLSAFNPYNGVTDEICRVYLARGLTPVPSHHDETEEFEIVFLPPDEIDEKIRSGEIWDGMTLAAWMLVREKIT